MSVLKITICIHIVYCSLVSCRGEHYSGRERERERERGDVSQKIFILFYMESVKEDVLLNKIIRQKNAVFFLYIYS